jgi:hypothetical protein
LYNKIGWSLYYFKQLFIGIQFSVLQHSAEFPVHGHEGSLGFFLHKHYWSPGGQTGVGGIILLLLLQR